jgi:hypothetical protein
MLRELQGQWVFHVFVKNYLPTKVCSLDKTYRGRSAARDF